MRQTLQAWWCGNCRTRVDSTDNQCVCGHQRIEKHAQVHVSDRAVIYVNPLTGEHATPARADQPMPEVYAQRGYVREEIMSMSAYEKATGVVHEASNFSPGNEPVLMDSAPPKLSPALKEDLINDMRDAIASGPFTSSSLAL